MTNFKRKREEFIKEEPHQKMQKSSEKEHVKINTAESVGQAWRKQHSITVFDKAAASNAAYKIPEPMLSFDDAPFSADIKKGLTAAGFSVPTNTQAQSWPIALSKRDLISVAKTGSGKTVGFLLPSFHQLDLTKVAGFGTRPRGTPPSILVLAPTRELCTQIGDEASKFGRTTRIRSTCVFGGAPKSTQIRALQNGVECLIATPGRLNDLLTMKKVDISKVKILILDEADRMLDMGFEPQIRSIIACIPRRDQRQTLLFSATWPKSIQKLANEFLHKPIQVNMGEINVLHANKDIKQHVYILEEKEKQDKLYKLIDQIVAENSSLSITEHAKTIVFVRTKRNCDKLAKLLWDDGYAVDSLHGDREQWERTKTMNDFKKGSTRLLFATDVAARGLDVKDIENVINYDMPGGSNGVEDYVHRIGRTGRAGAKGTAYTFFTKSDSGLARKLIEVLKNAQQDIPTELSAFGGRGGGGRGGGNRRFGGNKRFGGRGGGGGGRGRRW